jgi:hypothetical protein
VESRFQERPALPLDVRCASGSRSAHDPGGVPCRSVRSEPPGRAFDRSVRTRARCAHQQVDRSRDCDGSKKTGLGSQSVLHARCLLERHRGRSIDETGLGVERSCRSDTGSQRRAPWRGICFERQAHAVDRRYCKDAHSKTRAKTERFWRLSRDRSPHSKFPSAEVILRQAQRNYDVASWILCPHGRMPMA